MMTVMKVFAVGVAVGPRRVVMGVVVLPLDRRLMGMILMVPIIVAVGVLMRHRLVVVLVIMLLFQMQPDAHRHQQRARHLSLIHISEPTRPY